MPSTLPVSELSADNEASLELALWDNVKDGSSAELESYLEQSPKGTFATLARTRRDAAAPSPAGAVPPAPPDAAAEALDLAFWNSVKDSNRREELAAYVEQHPNDADRYVADWLRGKAPPSPRDGFSAPLILRFAVDDLRSHDLETGAVELRHPELMPLMTDR